jgi:Ca2+/Na+ antiporter
MVAVLVVVGSGFLIGCFLTEPGSEGRWALKRDFVFLVLVSTILVLVSIILTLVVRLYHTLP